MQLIAVKTMLFKFATFNQRLFEVLIYDLKLNTEIHVEWIILKIIVKYSLELCGGIEEVFVFLSSFYYQ